MASQVHWHEGLFLQPHHLQAADRHALERVERERRLAWSYPYGVIEYKLNEDELENMRVRFDRLRLVMPGGTYMDVRENADLPPLDVKKTLAGASGPVRIEIGIPIWYHNRANSIEPGGGDWRVKRLYRVSESEQFDENSGDNKQPMLIRKINARLLLPDDDHSELECMPIVRIAAASSAEGTVPKQDPNFIAPCMVVTGSPTLRDWVRDLASAVEAARTEAVVVINRGGFNLEMMRGPQVQQMMLLRTLNRFAGTMPAMAAAPGGISPFEMYLHMRELLGELSALTPGNDQWEVPLYDHDNPAASLLPLVQKIRPLLKPQGGETFKKLVFAKKGEFLAMTLIEEDTTKPNEYYLGIKHQEDPRAMAALVENENEFKLNIEPMIQTRAFGLKLKEERHPPLQLPASPGLQYFRVMRSEGEMERKKWERVQKDLTLAIQCPRVESRFDGGEVALYLTFAG
ncbi:MAG: type VI secretion system baseplate subunit TssK [Phycisphaerales bacterium]|nr:type VI secretion system baseplate subunit TssK [Phycisphaerales bacterium]